MRLGGTGSDYPACVSQCEVVTGGYVLWGLLGLPPHCLCFIVPCCGCGWGCMGGCDCMAVVIGGSVVWELTLVGAFELIPLAVGLTVLGCEGSRCPAPSLV